MVLESKTCCGFSLKHLTMLIGIVASIISFMSMILSAAYVEYPHELVDMTDPSIIPNKETLRAILIVCAVISAIQCILSILIIFGAETNRPVLLLPWLVYNPMFVIAYIISTIIALVHHTGINNTPFVIGNLIFVGIFLGIFSWTILTVFKLYKYQRSLNF